MPVTLAQAPALIAFSKNPVWLKLQSNDYLAAAPAAAVNYYAFTAAVAAGAVVNLSWTNGGANMTAAAAPDNSGNQFPAGDGGNAYVQSLVTYFQSNYFIDQAFILTADITGASPRLIFTARNQEADLTFTAGSNSGNITPGGDTTPVANFMHHLEVYFANLTGGFDKAYDANVPLDQNPVTGLTTLDLSGTLDSWLTQPGQLDMPELVNAYSLYKATIRAYYLKYAQFLGAVPAVQKVTTTTNYYAALGGLAQQQSLLRNIQTELCPVAGDDAANLFMRQGSLNKIVTQAQPEWLTYINLKANPVSLIMKVFVHYTDSSYKTFNITGAVTVQPYQKLQFQVGYTQLNLAALTPTKTIDYYTVTAQTNGGGNLSETYGYVIDQLYREWPRYFVYLNSYGAFQTIATVGKGQDEYDRTKDDAQLSLDRGTAAIQGDFLETNIRIQNKGTVNAGYDRAGKRNTKLLRDLMLSKQIYLYNIPAVGAPALIPVGLNTDNLKDAMDGDNVYANSFGWFAKYQEEVWTEPQGLPNDDIFSLITTAGGTISPTMNYLTDINGNYILTSEGDQIIIP